VSVPPFQENQAFYGDKHRFVAKSYRPGTVGIKLGFHFSVIATLFPLLTGCLPVDSRPHILHIAIYSSNNKP